MAISVHATTLPKVQPPKGRRTVFLPSKAEPSPQLGPINPADLPDRYGMIVKGDCLAPEVRDGATLVFDKTLPYSAGDLVVLFLRPELAPLGYLPQQVKRLVLAPPPWVKFPYRDHPDSNVRALLVAEQDNPPRQFSIACEDILAIHKCVGPLPAGTKAVRT